MKRPYLLIAGDQYYPSTGTRDWIGCFATVEEIIQEISRENESLAVIIRGRPYDWYEIVDLKEWTNQMRTSIEEITKIGEELRISSIFYETLLKDSAFITCPGSIDLHHNYPGGLVDHTLEVIKIGLSTIKTLDIKDFNTTVFFLAALYHDSGKMWDYEEGISGIWAKTKHCRTIHHISRSAMYWKEIAVKHGLHEDLSCKVIHCILSHHGQRAWGSPVSPSSKEAWLLHCSDMVSARLNDCDKIDILKAKQE